MAVFNNLRAGVAEVDISPKPGVQLVGYPTVLRPNTGVHDPLFADALVLANDKCKVALVTSDLVLFEKKFVAQLRRKIAGRSDIPGSNMLFCCSHTHAGPRMNTDLADHEVNLGGRAETEYLAELEEKLIDLVLRANAALREARIGFGAGRAGKEVGIGGNRHDPDGLCDPAVRVMGVQDATGQWLAALVKYSLHPTVLQMDNYLVSADYPFGIRQALTEARPGITVLFAQGATGDQSSRYFRRDQSFAEAERFGRAIGDEAIRVLDSITMSSDVAIGAEIAQVEPVWKELPPVGELEKRVADYWTQLRELEERDAPYVERQTCYLDRLGTELTLEFARTKAEGRIHPWETQVPIEVQAVRVGDACVVGIAGEVFAEYTLGIESASPYTDTFQQFSK